MLMSRSGNDFTCLRRLIQTASGYWRDGGQWGVDSRFDEETQTFRSVSHDTHLDDLEIRSCKQDEWAKDNEGYVDDISPEAETDEDLSDELPF